MKDDSLPKIIKTLFPYFKKQRPIIFGSLAALLLSTAMRLLEPWPLALVIDSVLSSDGIKNKASNILLSNNQWNTTTLLWFCAGSIIVIAALKAAMSYISTVGLAIVGSRMLSEVRTDLFAHLQRLSLRFHRSTKTGDLTMRLVNDIGMLREVMVTALMPMLANILILVGMFGVMLFIDWDLTLIALIPMPILIWSTRQSSQKIREVSRAQRKREGALASKTSEFMAAINTVQALSLESAAMKSFSGDDAKSMQQNVQSKRLSSALERRVDLIIAIATALVLLQGANDVIKGHMSPGDLIIFLSYLKNSFRPVKEYAKYTGRLAKAVAAGERITDLLDREPDIKDSIDAKPLPHVSGEIRFLHVSFDYDEANKIDNKPDNKINNNQEVSPEEDDRHTLNDLSFNVPAGQSIAVTGPSGSGKSTLTNLLLRLYDPQSGHILIDGVNIRDYTISSYRAQIGYVPQESLLFGLSIKENIALAAQRNVSDNEIIAAAQLANAHDFIMALPQGYDTVISERGSSLSGGQRQRISIARAAIRQNPILILDEPSVGLDSESEHYVIEALMRLMQKKTCFLITHNLMFASRTDHILFLENGQIVEQGTHEALLALAGRYAELWRLQGWSNNAEQTHDKYRTNYDISTNNG